MLLNNLFGERIHNAIRECVDFGYRPTRIQQMLGESNAVDVAKRLVTATEIQDGMKEMKKRGRMDLMVESIMLEPQFNSLFSKVDLANAAFRLRRLDEES